MEGNGVGLDSRSIFQMLPYRNRSTVLYCKVHAVWPIQYAETTHDVPTVWEVSLFPSLPLTHAAKTFSSFHLFLLPPFQFLLPSSLRLSNSVWPFFALRGSEDPGLKQQENNFISQSLEERRRDGPDQTNWQWQTYQYFYIRNLFNCWKCMDDAKFSYKAD